MISIILPTYNGTQYIRNAVASITQQTYTNIELIIVDDCSTDGTGALVDELAKYDERIHVIHNKVNKKLPASLNIGFENASGDYFTWTSDDNLYKYTALEIMLENLEKNPEVDIVYAMYDTINSEGKVIASGITQPKDNKEKFSTIHNWVGACFLYKREVHNRLHGYDENLFLVEDFDFWLRASRYFKYKKIDQNLYQYRIHDNSLTSRRKEEIMSKTIDLLERELEQGYVHPSDTVLLYKHFVNYYYDHVNNKKFRKYMKLLKKTKDNNIKINISYSLAEIIGIRIIKQIWRFYYILHRYSKKYGEEH